MTTGQHQILMPSDDVIIGHYNLKLARGDARSWWSAVACFSKHGHSRYI